MMLYFFNILFITRFLPSVYHFCASVHHLLSLELLYKRPLERNWPSSLPVSAGYSLIKAALFPAVTSMAGHYDGSGLTSCKIFINAPLGPLWIVHKHSRTVKHIYTLETQRQRQLNVDYDHSSSNHIFGEFLTRIPIKGWYSAEHDLTLGLIELWYSEAEQTVLKICT